MKLPLLFLSLGLVLAAVIAGCGGSSGDTAGPPSASGPAAGSPTARATLDDAVRAELAAPIRALDYGAANPDGASLGSADAPVVLAVYEDFQCPFCLIWTLSVEPMLVTEFVATGKLRLEFRNLPILGQDSVNAAIAGVCAAEQDVFWEFHRLVFLHQLEAGQLDREVLNDGRFNPDPLTALAVEAGAEREAFTTCLFDSETGPKVADEVRGANALGLRSTPSFLLNGEPITSPRDVAGWRALVQAAVDRASSP